MSDSGVKKQGTISESLTWKGIGLHTGEACEITAVPADCNYGIKFKKVDENGESFLNADSKYVSSTQRSTNLANSKLSIGTVEHLLAAIRGAGIDNLQIVIDGPEIPILDGSADTFYRDLQKNKVDQNENRINVVSIEDIIEFEDEESGSSYTLIPSDRFSIEAILDYQNVEIGRQYARFDESQDFGSLANARTFVLVNELEELCKAGLIKGGDLSNAVVVATGKESRETFARVLQHLGRSNSQELLEDFEKGFELRYDNELARHKILDLIGDLTLLGCQLNCKIIARRPGHTGNAALVKHLKPIVQKALKLKGKPKYDASAPPLFNSVQIQNYLPHRYPFLLVDKIIELSENHVVGVKNITFNEQLFQGHFPGNPVFPGVLQMEALAQTGGILALNNVENPSDWDTYFLKMDNVKFKNMVFPGDTLLLKMELVSPIRRGLVHMQGTAYVGDKIVSEGELIAHIVDRTKGS